MGHHINTADSPTAIAADTGAGEGHDLIERISSLAQYEKGMDDLTDAVTEANARHGDEPAMSRRTSFNPTTNVFCRVLRG